MFFTQLNVTIFSLSTSLLFCTYKPLNIKTSVLHCPVIQKEADEVLTKDANEPSNDGAGLYSNVFVVDDCIGDSHAILK